MSLLHSCILRQCVAAACEVRGAEQEALTGEESSGGAQAATRDGDVGLPAAQGQRRRADAHAGQEEEVGQSTTATSSQALSTSHSCRCAVADAH